MADADGGGIKDTDAYGCGLTTVTDTVEPVDNQTIDPDAVDDLDGISNGVDLCPDAAQSLATLTGVLVTNSMTGLMRVMEKRH